MISDTEKKIMKMSEMLSSVNNNNNNQNHYISPDYLSPTAASVSCQSKNLLLLLLFCYVQWQPVEMPAP